MADFLTPSDLVEAGQASLRTSLDPDGKGLVDLSPGSDLTTLVSASAAMMTPVLAHHADRVAARTLSGSTGADLDEILQDDFDTHRKDAAAATATVYLQRASTGATSIPKGSRVAVPAAGTQQAVMFAADDDVAVASGTTKIAVPVTCAAPGSQGNVQLAAITSIVDPLPDAGWSLYVPTLGDPLYPPADVGGGADEESDDTAKARVRSVASDEARQRGTLAAVQFGILEVPGVFDAVLVEPLDGTMVAYVGDVGFMLPTALQSAVQAAANLWRCAGVPVLVRKFTVTTVPVTLSVYLQRPTSQYATASLRAAVVAAVAAYFATTRPHPDEYTLDGIKTAAAEACGKENVQKVLLSTPTVDVLRIAPSAYSGIASMPRYVCDAKSITVTFLDPANS